MQSTGDVQGCLRKLETLLRAIKYPGYVDYNGLSKGDPSAFLPIVSFTLTSFSPPFAKQLMEAGLELTGKTDLRFTDTLYKVLRDIFHYKPILTKQQFLQCGFSQRKISVICDIINLVLKKHNQLKKPRVRCPASHKDDRGEAHPTLTDADTSSEVEGRLSALEAQLGSLLSGMVRLNILEKLLEKLDKHRITNKNEGEVITISRESWENLMSRVLLLETKLDLSNIQLSVPLPCPSSASSSSCTMSDASKEDLKDRLERITSMLKSTSSLLKNTSSSTTLQMNYDKYSSI
ncbi:centrosomal protein of 44 kDa isoform X3 [Cebidichthys violaceus]|uniref:centrosomal protein of 44 kDa isoform X3 n=1 Tax=Cebidichthys violaceus TaxID=271503 RepID=UPI0035CC450D